MLAGEQDFVIGSRIRGRREPGSMDPPQLIAGWLAGLLLRLLYGVRYTDMCPFRAIRRDALLRLGMREETYGWNLEMQMRAARAGLRILELPVAHRPPRRPIEGVRQSVGQPEGRRTDRLDLPAPGARSPLATRQRDSQVISARIRDRKSPRYDPCSTDGAMSASTPRLRPAR